MPVCWEALLGWLNTGLEVTAGVTLSVCWCVHICWGMCVSGLAHPPPVFPPSLLHRPMQTSWKPAGSVPPARVHTPLPLFPPLAQGAHTALGSMDPKPLSQASWLACPPPRGWWGHWGHGRQGRQVPCCCRSWLNIVPGQLGNTNRSGKEMKLLEQTRCAWQGSRLRDKVLPSTCQPARVIY